MTPNPMQQIREVLDSPENNPYERLLKIRAILDNPDWVCVPGWKPIDAAPKDGSPMLVQSFKGWIGRARWNDHEEVFEDEHTEFIDPSWLEFWMPLPPLAITAAGGR